LINIRFNPKPEAGSSKGLTLMLDAHSDLIAGASVSDDFQGFTAVIDSSLQYPLTTRKSVLIKPGHIVRLFFLLFFFSGPKVNTSSKAQEDIFDCMI
jgi:hypothetical protein